MFKIYSEKEAFEHTILFNDENPKMFEILNNHSQIHLNISNDELEKELCYVDSVIFNYVNSNGGRIPIASKDFFDYLKSGKISLDKHPRSLFILNVNESEAETMQIEKGILAVSLSMLKDELLTGSYYKNLPKKTKINDGDNKGWKALTSKFKMPINSVVLADNFIFKNTERGNIVGLKNLVFLFDSILPSNLNIPFHILIVSEDPVKGEEWYIKLYKDLKEQLNNLRAYEINIEIMFAKAIHKRKAMSNYFSITCDKGFAVFEPSDSETVREKNDFQLNKIFNRVLPSEGDPEFISTEDDLLDIKKIYLEIYEYIKNAGQTAGRRLIGDLAKDFKINNRLLNDIN